MTVNDQSGGRGPDAKRAPYDPFGLGRPLRVLVVDDDDDTRDMFELLLGTLGWHVTAASSAERAIACYDGSAVDLILTDLGLPEMDGYAMLAELRARSERYVPAVAVSGYGAAEDLEESGRAGFDGHVTKPVQLASLLELLAGLGRGCRE